jgi:hypothetical protein
VQKAPAGHALPHPPQFFTVVVSVQAPLHAVCPVGHTHEPLTQEAPTAQVFPHPPQFRIVMKSVQTFAQTPWPAGHEPH